MYYLVITDAQTGLVLDDRAWEWQKKPTKRDLAKVVLTLAPDYGDRHLKWRVEYRRIKECCSGTYWPTDTGFVEFDK